MTLERNNKPATKSYGNMIGYSLAIIHAEALLNQLNNTMFVDTQHIDTDNIIERVEMVREVISCLDRANEVAEQISKQNRHLRPDEPKLIMKKLDIEKIDQQV